MRFKTVIVFALGYAAAEYGVFGRALAAVPEEFRLGAELLIVGLVVASLVDRYYVTPRARRQVRQDG